MVLGGAPFVALTMTKATKDAAPRFSVLYSPVNSNKWYSHRVEADTSADRRTFSEPPAPALQNGFATWGPNAQSVVGAMAAGGQLSQPLAAVTTNIIEGTAELTTAAAPYVVPAIGYGVAFGTNYILGTSLVDEANAAWHGHCVP